MSRWFRRMPNGFRNGRFLSISWCGGASIATTTEKNNSNPSTATKSGEAKPKNASQSYGIGTWIASIWPWQICHLFIPIVFGTTGQYFNKEKGLFKSDRFQSRNIDPIVYTFGAAGIVFLTTMWDKHKKVQEMSAQNAVLEGKLQEMSEQMSEQKAALEGKLMVREAEFERHKRDSIAQFKEYQKIMATNYDKYKEKVDKKYQKQFNTYKEQVDKEFERYKKVVDEESKKKEKEEHYFVVAHDIFNGWQLHHFNSKEAARDKYDSFYLQSSKLLAKNNQVEFCYFANDRWKKIVQDMYIQYSSQFAMKDHKLK